MKFVFDAENGAQIIGVILFQYTDINDEGKSVSMFAVKQDDGTVIHIACHAMSGWL